MVNREAAAPWMPPVKPGHDGGVWRDKTLTRHHAILPLFCPTEQRLFCFSEVKKKAQ
jgi:hypothetical protein